MVLVCPQCESKVVTPTGYPLEKVACGNCGTEITVPKEPKGPADPTEQATSEAESKKSWWRRLFG
jgi:DNA-directed RNA polymerase subunit RPC12/RpoP